MISRKRFSLLVVLDEVTVCKVNFDHDQERAASSEFPPQDQSQMMQPSFRSWVIRRNEDHQ